jgi:uncharacterized repeat protein (TIGR03837 family)
MWRWDIFCHVVDNFGDVGICWRLAQQLAFEHHQLVRLWVDDLERFACLCPSINSRGTGFQPVIPASDEDGRPEADPPFINSIGPTQHVGPIEIRLWPKNFPDTEPADVVIEAFACTIPDNFVLAMTKRLNPPVWINLEYLSAENWVEDCHGLPSPHSTLRLNKYFFFPGFTARTGGLLRERDLLADRAMFDETAVTQFWHDLGVEPPSPDELTVSLFCYENAALPELLETWSESQLAYEFLCRPDRRSSRSQTGWANH